MTTEQDVDHSDDELNVVVRRVIGARVRDPYLVEDLTQETLLRVTTARNSLSGDALRAYAIVTARNLVIGQARRDAVHERHAHRLVDYTTFDGPETLTLEREETDALAAALEQLDPADRHVLLRHEADGVTTETLAAEGGTSKGAVAMRLARARAGLRVEFVVAFRRVDLPTSRCRPVLLALSAGDRRRQHELGAAAHLLRCSTCAELARPVTERRRGIAAWLIIPAAEVVRRAVTTLRHHHGAQIVAAMAGTVTAVCVASVVAFQQSDDPPEQTAAAVPATPVERTATTTPAPVVSSVTSATVAVPVAATPRCPPPAPLEQLDPLAAIGCPIAPTSLSVVEVPADEGFWAATADGRTVWVQLAGTGESPLDVDVADVVVVVGLITEAAALGSAANGPIADAGFFVEVDYQDITPV